MPYKPINSYGLIGNMHSAALVGCDGSLDWLCLPAFDSPSVFGAILDERKGGSFRLELAGDGPSSSQLYWPDTNVLLTRLRSDTGVAEITDFMPVRTPAQRTRPPDLVRMICAETGPVRVRLRCRPAFDYARRPHETDAFEGGVVFDGGRLSLLLRGSVDLRIDGDAAAAEFDLETGEFAVFALQQDRGDERRPFWDDEARALLEENIAYWRRWIGRCTYTGRWRDVVRRSALALKLLTYEPTGAIIAAPTCSLPETIGGVRNWDYRYTWLRDAGYMVYAFLRIGFTQEAASFMEWLKQRCHEVDAETMLRPLYGIDGRCSLPEEVLDHLDGYRGSRPVRVGNAACEQLQLDVSGALLDAVYLHNKHAMPVGYAMWNEIQEILGWVCGNWNRPDDGIWEVRSGQQHFVFSRLMCWVALDRGLRLAGKRSFPGDLGRWREHRDRIYREIMDRGFSDRLNAFRQQYGADELDAANLLMPLVFFIAPNDERMVSTLEAVAAPRARGGLVEDFVVRRYDPGRVDDGVGGEEGAFNMCTFWLIEAMTRAGRSDRRLLERAEILFNRMLGCAGPLGLYAEQTGKHREALGNYPQGFTHLSLISAAYNLDRVLGD